MGRGTTRKPAQPPPASPSEWETLWQDIQVAAIVGLTVAAVVLGRRWLVALVGKQLLSDEIFGGSVLVNELIQSTERKVAGERRTDAGPDGPGNGGAREPH